MEKKSQIGFTMKPW